MKNTITISVQDDFLENRAHGDTAFPCAAYYTDASTHDIRWHWHEEYELIGDYYFPCLTVPTEEEQPVGIWGQRHKRYIKEYHPALYNALLLNGRLNSYLADIDQQAQERLDTIIEQMARSQGITEALKAADQMTWVGKMNNIQASAMEIV